MAIELVSAITMRTPFPPHHISKLPKPTKAQTDEVRADFKKGIRCEVCGGWHHPKVVHLDYVGHAALTDRLLDVDPSWNWEPIAMDSNGLPAIDGEGGLWIRLTVNGVTRIGYGDAQGKAGGDAMKERIGDALRNAAMRFGAALDLWHKGDLHPEEVTEEKEKKPRLPALSYAEAEKQYHAWTDEKSKLVYPDGTQNEVKVTEAWGAKPSNVRTAIGKFGRGEFEEQQQEVSPESQAHLNSI